MHAVPSDPVYPARHVQSVIKVLVDGEKVKAGHAEHVCIYYTIILYTHLHVTYVLSGRVIESRYPLANPSHQHIARDTSTNLTTL